INDLVIVFNLQGVIYSNKNSKRLLGLQPADWKDVFSNASIQSQLEAFFGTGKLPKRHYLQIPTTKNDSDLFLEWRFEGLSLGHNEKICLAIGSIVPEIPNREVEDAQGTNVDSDKPNHIGAGKKLTANENQYR